MYIICMTYFGNKYEEHPSAQNANKKNMQIIIKKYTVSLVFNVFNLLIFLIFTPLHKWSLKSCFWYRIYYITMG